MLRTAFEIELEKEAFYLFTNSNFITSLLSRRSSRAGNYDIESDGHVRLWSLSVSLSVVALTCALTQELESISAKTGPSSHVQSKGGSQLSLSSTACTVCKTVAGKNRMV